MILDTYLILGTIVHLFNTYMQHQVWILAAMFVKAVFAQKLCFILCLWLYNKNWDVSAIHAYTLSWSDVRDNIFLLIFGQICLILWFYLLHEQHMTQGSLTHPYDNHDMDKPATWLSRSCKVPVKNYWWKCKKKLQKATIQCENALGLFLSQC